MSTLTKKAEPFAYKTKAYLKKLTQLNRYLANNHKTHKNVLRLYTHCNKIDSDLMYNQYNDKQMAAYILRNKTIIQELIPGIGSNNHSHFYENWHELISRANIIVSLTKAQSEL